MVRYVILRRNLREIPPHISFQPARMSAWLFAKRDHLHGVQNPAPATWSTLSAELPDNVSLLSYPDNTVSMSAEIPADEGSLMKNWPEADGNDGGYSPEDPPPISATSLQWIPDPMLDTSHWVDVPVIPAHTRAPFLMKTLTG